MEGVIIMENTKILL